MKLTEKELQELLSKTGVKISSSFGGQKKEVIPVTSTKPQKKIVVEPQKPEKKPKGIDVTNINKINKEAEILSSCSDTHFSLLFKGARLLSLNQIFAILERRHHVIFGYKKCWHTIIQDKLFEMKLELEKKGKSLPFFSQNVEITLFRQSTRLVDEDALAIMFKFIIDALKKSDENPNGILQEDNPEIVSKIVTHGKKGPHAIGIRIRVTAEPKQSIEAEEILLP